MYIIPLYKYKVEIEGRKGTCISTFKPECDYILMYRLLPHDENHTITNYIEFYDDGVDIEEYELSAWHEINKNDLNPPLPQLSKMEIELEKLQIIEDEQDSMIIDLATELAILQLTM